MSEFAEEFVDRLQESFSVSEGEAREVAQKATRYRAEVDSTVTPEFLTEEMEKRRRDSLISTWNTTIGFLFADGWDIGDEKGADNPYKL